MSRITNVIAALRGRRPTQVVRTAVQVARSRRQFRQADHVGTWTRVVGGRVHMTNQGTLNLGERVRFHCELGPTEVRVLSGGTLDIGDRTVVNYGTDIIAGNVTLGSSVSVGPRCIIGDATYGADAGASRSDAAAIVVGDDVWLAARVTLLPGARIGAGSVITAGSVVEGTIPSGVVAGGSPVRVLRHLSDQERTVRVVGDDHVDTDGVATALDTDRVSGGPAVRLLLVSDFTIDSLGRALEMNPGGIDWQVDVAPFGAVVPTLLEPPAEAYDASVVWTQPQAVLPTFAAVLDGEAVAEQQLRSDVDALASLIRSGLSQHSCVVVPTWTVPPWLRDGRAGGVSWAISVVNSRLIEVLGRAGNVTVADTDAWLGSTRTRGDNERAWYLGKVPFDDAVFDRAATAVRESVTSAMGLTVARKLVVVDLDNTLWGGVVGDVGWDGVQLGGHDADGEAFVDFQRALARLRKRGVILAIASKNDEATALEVLDRHEEMVLRRGDFVAWRIDWNDKAANIAAMVADLNIGLQSVVFIDDSPHERQRVKEALPEVLVPEWPDDPTSYPRALAELRCFPTVASTDEDARRTEMYQSEHARDELRSEVGNIDEWIEQLGIVVRIASLDPSNLPRAAQLLNKTNQMNLTTRRLSERELEQWSRGDGRRLLCASVSDRLGDAGLTGIVSVEVDGSTARLVDFVLSCRVMGRRIEGALLHVGAVAARNLGASELVAEVIPTAKNSPCQRFFEDSVMRSDAAGLFRVPLTEVPPPSAIRVDWDAVGSR